jgi:hypothetical protein
MLYLRRLFLTHLRVFRGMFLGLGLGLRPIGGSVTVLNSAAIAGRLPRSVRDYRARSYYDIVIEIVMEIVIEIVIRAVIRS